MSKLNELRSKRRKRVTSRKQHYAYYLEHKKKGRKARAAWQLAAMKRDERANKKLLRLIAKELKRVENQRVDWNGCPALAGSIKEAARFALAAASGLFITATTNGTHSATSWHYKSKAFDAGSNGSRGESPEIEAQEALLVHYGAGHFAELFGPAGWYVKNGAVYQGTFPGHGDHLHAAIA